MAQNILPINHMISKSLAFWQIDLLKDFISDAKFKCKNVLKYIVYIRGHIFKNIFVKLKRTHFTHVFFRNKIAAIYSVIFLKTNRTLERS